MRRKTQRLERGLVFVNGLDRFLGERVRCRHPLRLPLHRRIHCCSFGILVFLFVVKQEKVGFVTLAQQVSIAKIRPRRDLTRE